MWHGDGSANDLCGGRTWDGGSLGWACGLGARDHDGGDQVDGSDWNSWCGSSSDGQSRSISDDGWVLWNEWSADTLEEVLGLVDLLVGSTVSRKTLVDLLD